MLAALNNFYPKLKLLNYTYHCTLRLPMISVKQQFSEMLSRMDRPRTSTCENDMCAVSTCQKVPHGAHYAYHSAYWSSEYPTVHAIMDRSQDYLLARFLTFMFRIWYRILTLLPSTASDILLLWVKRVDHGCFFIACCIAHAYHHVNCPADRYCKRLERPRCEREDESSSSQEILIDKVSIIETPPCTVLAVKSIDTMMDREPEELVCGMPLPESENPPIVIDLGINPEPGINSDDPTIGNLKSIMETPDQDSIDNDITVKSELDSPPTSNDNTIVLQEVSALVSNSDDRSQKSGNEGCISNSGSQPHVCTPAEARPIPRQWVRSMIAPFERQEKGATSHSSHFKGSSSSNSSFKSSELEPTSLANHQEIPPHRPLLSSKIPTSGQRPVFRCHEPSQVGTEGVREASASISPKVHTHVRRHGFAPCTACQEETEEEHGCSLSDSNVSPRKSIRAHPGRRLKK